MTLDWTLVFRTIRKHSSHYVNMYTSVYAYIYIYIHRCIHLCIHIYLYNYNSVCVWTHIYVHTSQETRPLTSGWFILKTQKMVPDMSLLDSQHYKVCIKGKVEQSRERSSIPSILQCSSYWKESLWAALDYGCQLYFYLLFYMHIYIYIYVCVCVCVCIYIYIYIWIYLSWKIMIAVTNNLFQFQTTNYMGSSTLLSLPPCHVSILLEGFLWDVTQLLCYSLLDNLYAFKMRTLYDTFELGKKVT